MFSKRKSVSTTHVAIVTDQNLDFVCTWLHRGRKKKYVVLVRSKCWDGFPQWKSMWSLTPNIEEGEGVGEGMLFSPSISFKFPSSSLVDVHFLVLQLREFSSIQGRWHYCPHFYGPIVIIAICKFVEVTFRAPQMVWYICHHPCLRLREVQYFAKGPVDG